MAAPVFYSLSPFGTGTIETGDGTIAVTSSVATLSVEQTGNIGVGVEIEYNSLHVYIAPNRLGFDSGGTAELLVDTKIEGGTSGATGIVRFVEVTSGTWAGGDAAGWIYFEKTTGTFQNNEQINRTKPTTSNNIATVNGTIEGNIGNGNTEFVVKTATGGTPANQTATAVTSIHHVWASLSAFEGAFTGASYINNASLVAADVVAHACCYYDHDDSTADTTAVTIDWAGTTDATRYLQIFTPTGNAESINNQRHDGKWQTAKYRLQAAVTSDGVLHLNEEYMKFCGLQVMNTHTSAGSDAGAIKISHNSATDVDIDKCIVRFEDTGASMSYRSVVRGGYQAGGTLRIKNTIVYDATGGTTQYTNGIHYSAGTWHLYHCTINNCETGIEHESGTGTVKNCAIFDCTNDINNSPTIDYCASDDGDGTNAVDWANGATDWANVFTDYANDDFSLKNYTAAGIAVIEQGTSLASSEGIWRDIAGNERGATPDIGAFEYVAAGEGLSIPVAMLQMNQFNGGSI